MRIIRCKTIEPLLTEDLLLLAGVRDDIFSTGDQLRFHLLDLVLHFSTFFLLPFDFVSLLF